MSEMADAMRLALMDIAEKLEPVHEFVLGGVAYYVRQGFTVEQAHAIAAAEYITIFGLRIANNATIADDDG